jgi:hypothetical protein
MAMDNANLPDGIASTPDGDKQILATALVLAKKGLSPTWLRGKSPFEKDWQNKGDKSADELRQSYVPGYNLGIRCGKWSCPKPGYGLVVVDVDVYDPAYAQEAYEKLTELTGGAAGAYVISGSRRGGRHCWYACPLDKLPTGSRKVLAKSGKKVEVEIRGERKTKPAWVIEVLMTGAQVVVPPSIHPDTGLTYEWGEGWSTSDAVPDIPEELLNALVDGGRPPPKTQSPALPVETPLGKCLFMQHCHQAAAGLEEPLWHAAACNLAVCEGGREAFHAMSKRDAARYNPEETDRKFDRAVKEGKPHTCEKIKELGFPCPQLRSDGSCAIHGGRAPAGFNQSKKSKKSKNNTICSKVLKLTDGFRLTHDADDKTYAQIPAGDHYVTMRIGSDGFDKWLRHEFYRRHQKVAGDRAINDALKLFKARALFEGEQVQAYRRVAPYKGGILLDLCNPNWECVQITKEGWGIIPIPQDAILIRTRGMLEITAPVRGGSLDELLEYINICKDDHLLVFGWLLAALNPSGPYPILTLQGEQGSAKSTTTRNLRSLIDPNSAPLRSLPTKERDLIIAASNSRINCWDNLSGLSDASSDRLCRLSTGGGFSTRELYEDDEEALFEVMRPIILNGIDEIAARNDLLDRSLIVNTPVIPPDQRRDEKSLAAALENARPRILGALLDAVSCALHNRETTTLKELPRMADFAIWATAAEPALGLQPGEFMAAYNANRRAAIQLNLEQNSLAEAIKNRVVSGPIRGNYREILDQLRDQLRKVHFDPLPLDFPKTARGLANKLKRLIPALRSEGIEVKINDRSHGKNHVEIRDVVLPRLEKQLEEQYAT